MASLTNILGGPWAPPAEQRVDSPEAQLRDAMLAVGLEPPEVIHFDGKIHRFRSGTKGRPGHTDKPGWYLVFGDGVPAGRFGCWRAGIEVTWKANIGRQLTDHEEAAYSRRLAEAQALRDAALKRQHDIAAETVLSIWTAAQAAHPDHPYLARKGIQTHGARVTGDGRLIVPLYDDDGTLSSLQYIGPEGGKMYHPGGQTGGKFWIVGTMDEPGTIYIAEGFATAATIHEATGRPCIVAYSASSLVPVTEAMRERYGATQDIVIVADHDSSGVGQKYADQASAKFGARVVMPPIPGMDANDYAKAGHDLAGLLVPAKPQLGNVVPIMEFMREGVGISYVWQHILAQGWLYAMTANPGSGKTSVSLYLSVMMALGRPLMGKKTKPCRVLFLCGENPQDVRLRMEVMLLDMGVPVDALDGRIYFTRRPFAIDDRAQLARFVAEAMQHGPYDLMVIDTGPAHSSAEDENDNRAMHALAMAMRELMDPLGRPCTIVLMHPPKGATRETLAPRGGSAFIGSIDACLCLWRNDGETTTEFFPHGQKFRGRHFDSMFFELQPMDHPTELDNFGDPIGTVVAKPGARPQSDDAAGQQSTLPKGVSAAKAMFEAAVIHGGGYFRAMDGLPYISAEKWNDYEAEANEYPSDGARRKALFTARDALIKYGALQKVPGAGKNDLGGYHATEQGMAGIFNGAFFGLPTYGKM